MKPPKNPDISFLVEALRLNPDEFFDALYQADIHNVFDVGILQQEDFAERFNCISKDVRIEKRFSNVIALLTRNNVANQDLRLYNDETVDSWNELVAETRWNKVDNSAAKSIYEFVRKIGKQCLFVQDNNVYFKMDCLERWQEVSFRCGEDLFVTAMLADMNTKSGYEPAHFQWDYKLKSDFFLLNNLMAQKKIVENHFHLGGSSPRVDVSWIYLMNHPLGQEQKFENFWKSEKSFSLSPVSYMSSKRRDMYTLVKVAAYIRIYLFFKVIRDFKHDELQNPVYEIYRIMNTRAESFLSNMESIISLNLLQSDFTAFDNRVDYAIRYIRVKKDDNNAYITGERHFYYSCIRHIFSHADDIETQLLFYLYILIKHSYNRMFIQSNNRTGFNNFREYNTRQKELMSSVYKSFATNMAIQGNIRENHLEQLEIRIAPKKTVGELTSQINNLDSKSHFRSTSISMIDRVFPNGLSVAGKRYGDGTDKYFYVLHFLKTKDMTWYEKDEIGRLNHSLCCREFKKREEYRKQAEVFMEMRERGDEVCSRVFGIDAANNEVNFRPENFGTVFRYLSSYKIRQNDLWERRIPDLRKTYHAGEDFYEITDGLRAIDEAVLFLGLSQGDRIGHGVALGIDVETWYNRHSEISLPRQNKMDNIAWMMYKIREWGIDVSTAYFEKLSSEFEALYWDVFGEMSPGLMKYIEAWELRGDDPEHYRNRKPPQTWNRWATRWEREGIRNKEIYNSFMQKDEKEPVYRLYHRYHYDNEVKKRSKERVIHVFSPEYVEIAKKLQIKMRSFISEKGISIESCPSSNFLISNLDEFKEIPTFRLFPIEETENDFHRLNVCINTDDQGVFYTTLSNEYTILTGTLHKMKEDGMKKYSDDKIMDWASHLIENGKRLSFRTGNVRNYGIRSTKPFEEPSESPQESNRILPFNPLE